MDSYILALGSNIRPDTHFRAAMLEMDRRTIRILKRTPDIHTPAWGYTRQPAFTNAGLLIRTNYRPQLLITILKNIEVRSGRVSRPRWHQREIDIDILWWSAGEIRTPRLTIPHPGNRQRPWVQLILAALLPDACALTQDGHNE